MKFGKAVKKGQYNSIFCFVYNDMLLHYNPSIVILRIHSVLHTFYGVLFPHTLFYSHPHCFIHIHTVLFTSILFYSHSPCFIHIYTILFASTLFYSHPPCVIHIHPILFASTLFHSHLHCSIPIHTALFTSTPNNSLIFYSHSTL